MPGAGQGGVLGRWHGVVDLLVRRGVMMRTADLNAVRAYWEALRGEAVVPARAQVDPRGIESALDIAFLAERIAPGHARLRIAGSELNALMGMEVRGMPLSALILPDGRERFAAALEQVFAAPAIAEIALRSSGRMGQRPIGGRMLVLPLSDDEGAITRALGAVALDARPAAATRRLEVVGIKVTPLGRASLRAAPAHPPAALPESPETRQTVPGLAEAPAPFAAPPRRKPRLRLIRNDDD